MSYIYINGEPINSSLFPGGEVKVTIPSSTTNYDAQTVTAYLYNSEAVMQLVMVTNALRQVDSYDKFYQLEVPYFPYARQDRVCNKGESHGVQAMAGLINSLGYDRVYVLDPHSEAVQAAVKNCHVVKQATLAKELLCGLVLQEKWELVCPDAGAEKKVNELAKELGSWGLVPPVYYASKVRNLSNGKILSTRFEGDVKDKNLIIVDDICDGGRTFIELSKVLKEKGASKVALYVTHGIFSQGIEVLKEHLDHVYCVHSFTEPSSDYLSVSLEK
jgi:ribose-phosphate pyrophosphokinase